MPNAALRAAFFYDFGGSRHYLEPIVDQALSVLEEEGAQKRLADRVRARRADASARRDADRPRAAQSASNQPSPIPASASPRRPRRQSGRRPWPPHTTPAQRHLPRLHNERITKALARKGLHHEATDGCGRRFKDAVNRSGGASSRSSPTTRSPTPTCRNPAPYDGSCGGRSRSASRPHKC